jgi:hypothetical protein
MEDSIKRSKAASKSAATRIKQEVKAVGAPGSIERETQVQALLRNRLYRSGSNSTPKSSPQWLKHVRECKEGISFTRSLIAVSGLDKR